MKITAIYIKLVPRRLLHTSKIITGKLTCILTINQKERQKRMTAADDSSNEDGNSSGDDDDDESSKPIKHISGDDLGDSFSDDSKLRTKAVWIDDILGRVSAADPEREDDSSSGESENDEDEDEEDEAEESDEDNGEYKKAQSLKDWEQSDDDVETNLEDEEEDSDDDDDNDDGTGKQVDKVEKKKIFESSGKQNDGAGAYKVKTNVKDDVYQTGELPYTIEAPKDFEEFSALLENRSNDQILEAIRRIRTFNAIAVAAENRKKMQV